MALIMMDIAMAKRSIMYDTNETYDSSKVVEVSRAMRWHERNTLNCVDIIWLFCTKRRLPHIVHDLCE